MKLGEEESPSCSSCSTKNDNVQQIFVASIKKVHLVDIGGEKYSKLVPRIMNKTKSFLKNLDAPKPASVLAYKLS